MYLINTGRSDWLVESAIKNNAIKKLGKEKNKPTNSQETLRKVWGKC